jgi:hypothetical protein
MTLRCFRTIGLLSSLCCIGMVFAYQEVLAVDATFLATPPASTAGNDAPMYDSEYAAEVRLHGGFGNTPEADARPGEYFFLLGADAVRKADYTFAIQMYQAAASWAFKPAEYNLGVMYTRGQGVPVDLSRGMAWMALAAERNYPRYVDARETVYAALTPEQFEQANVIWRDLKKTYGDAVALRRAKARWAEVRSKMTGSRVGGGGNLQVGTSMSSPGEAGNSPKLVAALPASLEGKNSRGADKSASNIKGFKISPAGARNTADLTGGENIDGSIAYRQFRESDNPYDPKFEPGALGKATVGPLKQLPSPPEEKTPDNSDPAKKDQQN